MVEVSWGCENGWIVMPSQAHGFVLNSQEKSLVWHIQKSWSTSQEIQRYIS
jgi:hypothetical protein